jgi:hypothetical protein
MTTARAVFLKATIHTAGQAGLFDAPVQVAGHVRGGTYVAPFSSTRKKRAALPAPQPSGKDGQWHTDTMARMRTLPDESLRFIVKDASEASRAMDTIGSPKAGQYADEAHYAQMEINRRRGGGRRELELGATITEADADKIAGEVFAHYNARKPRSSASYAAMIGGWAHDANRKVSDADEGKILAAMMRHVDRLVDGMERETAAPKAGEHHYHMLYRPPGFATLPQGVKWEYSGAPRGEGHRFPNIPESSHRHGTIKTDRQLTPEELSTYQVMPTDNPKDRQTGPLQDGYAADVRRKPGGKALYQTAVYPTHDEAAKMAYSVHPTARHVTTHRVNRGIHTTSDIRFHKNPGAREMPEIIGTIGRHKSRPERLAIIRPDGTAALWCGQHETDDELRATLTSNGYSVAEDGTVTRP